MTTSWYQTITNKVSNKDITELCKIFEFNMYPWKVEYDKETQNVLMYRSFEDGNKEQVWDGKIYDRHLVKNFPFFDSSVKSLEGLDRIFPNLQCFKSGGGLTEFPHYLTNIKSLTFIKICEKHITTLPKEICDMPKLRRIHFAGSDIKQIPCYNKETNKYTFAESGKSDVGGINIEKTEETFLNRLLIYPCEIWAIKSDLMSFTLNDNTKYLGRCICISFVKNDTYYDELHRVYIEKAI